MENKTFKVPAIGCEGCTKAIIGELSAMPGVTSVQAAVDTKLVSVQWNAPATCAAARRSRWPAWWRAWRWRWR